MRRVHHRIVLTAVAIFVAQLAKAQEPQPEQPQQVAPEVKCILDAQASKHPQWVKAVSCFNNGLTEAEAGDTPSAREIIFRYEDKIMATAIDADHKRISGAEFTALFHQQIEEMTSAMKANVQDMQNNLAAEKQQMEDQKANAEEQRKEELASQAQARLDAQRQERRAASDAFLLNMMKPQPMPRNPSVNCTTSYVGQQAYTHCQ